MNLNLFLKYILVCKNGDENQQKHSKLFTKNILDKLKISCIEDIGVGCIIMVIHLNIILEEFKEELKNNNTMMCLFFLYKISLLLGNKDIERTRQVSFVKQVFYTKFKENPDLLNNEKEYEKIDDELGFYKKFEEGKEFCLFYLFRILNDKKNKKKINKIIDYIINKNKNEIYNDIFYILKEWYNTCKTKEYFIFVTQIVLIYLYNPSFKNIYIKIENFDKIMFQLTTKKIKLKRIFFDINVKMIKKYNKFINPTHSFFALESSKVINESNLTNLKYKKEYEEYKKNLDK